MGDIVLVKNEDVYHGDWSGSLLRLLKLLAAQITLYIEDLRPMGHDHTT